MLLIDVKNYYNIVSAPAEETCGVQVDSVKVFVLYILKLIVETYTNNILLQNHQWKLYFSHIYSYLAGINFPQNLTFTNQASASTSKILILSKVFLKNLQQKDHKIA